MLIEGVLSLHSARQPPNLALNPRTKIQPKNSFEVWTSTPECSSVWGLQYAPVGLIQNLLLWVVFDI